MSEGILPYAKSRLSKIGFFSQKSYKTHEFLAILLIYKGGGKYGNSRKFGYDYCSGEKWCLCVERFLDKVNGEARDVAQETSSSSKVASTKRQISVDFRIDVFSSLSFANGGLFIG